MTTVSIYLSTTPTTSYNGHAPRSLAVPRCHYSFGQREHCCQHQLTLSSARKPSTRNPGKDLKECMISLWSWRKTTEKPGRQLLLTENWSNSHGSKFDTPWLVWKQQPGGQLFLIKKEQTVFQMQEGRWSRSLAKNLIRRMDELGRQRAQDQTTCSCCKIAGGLLRFNNELSRTCSHRSKVPTELAKGTTSICSFSLTNDQLACYMNQLHIFVSSLLRKH